jgi:hypothetical protein
MYKPTLVKYLKSQINECKKLLERAEDRAYKAHLQGQIYAFELVLREVENEKNPDYQEPTIFDKLLCETKVDNADDVYFAGNSGYVRVDFTADGTVVYAPTNNPEEATSAEELKKYIK